MPRELPKIVVSTIQSLVRSFFPRSIYQLPILSTDPVSGRFGYDRGNPIDRVWISDYVKKVQKHIHGVCLEIGDDRYTREFGSKIKRVDILDVEAQNKKATIITSLTDTKKKIKDESYDCILLTHVLGLIDEPSLAISECYRILKKGGVLIVTTACLAPQLPNNEGYYRFTPKGLKYLLSKYFGEKNVEVDFYGNSLASSMFFVGFCEEDLTKKEITAKDARFPGIVGGVAFKK